MTCFHILNGDCLSENFPLQLSSDKIVWRESLVDGPISKKDFFINREAFISQNYHISTTNYYEKVMVEFEKIKAVPEKSEVFFWFGDDLFCQINFWFLISVIKEKNLTLYRVFPNKNQYDFEDFDAKNIDFFLDRAKLITQKEKNNIVHLWKQYQKKNTFEMISSEIISKFETLKVANDNRFNGILKKELDSLQTESQNFEEFFRKFQEKFPMYGFGDLQLKNAIKKE